GCLPSRSVIEGCVASATDMTELGHQDMTEHYVLTLRHWRRRFARAAEQLDPFRYDTRFRRLWDLYLSYSEGGFAERRIRVGQYLLGKPGFRPEWARAARLSAPGPVFAGAAPPD